MLDLNWKTAFLIVVLVVGGMFELIKHLPVRASSNWSLDGLRLGGDTTPYSVKASRASGMQLPKPTAYKAPQSGGLNLAAQMEKFAKLNAVNTTEAAAPAVKEKGKEGADEYEIYIDPKTGKMMKKKKKKKTAKKKDEDKKEEVAVEESPEVKDELKDRTEQQPEVYATGNTQPQQAEQKKKAPVFGSAEDWMARLLEKPDAKETRRFIQAYHSNLVTAAVFYKIVELMIADQRVEMKQLGVLCLSQTPSVHSFELLAQMQEHERLDSDLGVAINRAVDQYAQLENLRILEKILSSDAGYTTVLAARKVYAAANTYLTATDPSGTATGTPAPTQDPNNPQIYSVSTNAQYFTRFLDLLSNLVSTSKDRSVAEEAQRTLTELQGLLQPSQITASAT